MSKLKEKIKSGKFVITAELQPPKTPDYKIIEKKLKYYTNIDAINITDNQISHVRACPLAVSSIVIKNGFEPVMQVTVRDRNRLALLSDAIGAWLIGVRNVLCLTGDAIKFGEYPDAKSVNDLSVMELISMYAQLNSGKLLNGKEFPVSGFRTDFFIGAALNPSITARGAKNRLKQKITSGAQFFQTQPVFDSQTFTNWIGELKPEVPVLAGVFIFKSEEQIKYMVENVPGFVVPASYVETVVSNFSVDKSIEFAVSLAKTLKESRIVKGIHIMTVGFPEAVEIVAKNLNDS
ncbi:MAG: methylenetetrahydrofolate reductase [bacterium]|nr:methylenetetrahydrofolate reductase [bacterium]